MHRAGLWQNPDVFQVAGAQVVACSYLNQFLLCIQLLCLFPAKKNVIKIGNCQLNLYAYLPVLVLDDSNLDAAGSFQGRLVAMQAALHYLVPVHKRVWDCNQIPDSCCIDKDLAPQMLEVPGCWWDSVVELKSRQSRVDKQA